MCDGPYANSTVISSTFFNRIYAFLFLKSLTLKSQHLYLLPSLSFPFPPFVTLLFSPGLFMEVERTKGRKKGLTNQRW